MRKAACAAVVVLAYALVVLVSLSASANASGSSATLTLVGASTGTIGSNVTYHYNWDVADCAAAGVASGDTVVLTWVNPDSSEPIGMSTVAIGGAGGSCSATVSGPVPGDATAGDDDVSTAAVDSGALPIGGSEAIANRAFHVTPSPTPRPTARPTPRPTTNPRPSASPTSTDRRHVSPVRDPTSSSSGGTGAPHTAKATRGGRSSRTASISATGSVADRPNLLADIPGGWFGLGLFSGVALLLGIGASFLTLERRRFARMYPKDGASRGR
jgi:hypothetical protein